MRRPRRQGRRAGRIHQDLGLPRAEPRPRGAGRQSRQGLPAAGRRVRLRRLREDDELRPRFAGLRRLLSLASVAPLQGAVQRGLLVDDRRRRGVRRPQQHGRRPRQHLLALRPEDDRGVDHLHGGSHRRRPAFLHPDGEGQGVCSEGIRRPLRPYAGLRRQPCRRLRRGDQGHSRALLEGRRAHAERQDQHHPGLRRLLRRQQSRAEAPARHDGRRIHDPLRRLRPVRHALRRRVPHV